jgi:hypothetical protein
MGRSLAIRYQFGHSDWPSHFSPEGELVYGIPARLQRLNELAEQQVAAMDAAANRIAASNLAGAQVVAGEVVDQARELRESIAEGAADISDAVDRLSDRVCCVEPPRSALAANRPLTFRPPPAPGGPP